MWGDPTADGDGGDDAEQAVAEIQKWGGKVVRDGTANAPVVAVVFDRKGATDGGLPYLSVLKQLQTLDLSASKVTDAGLEHLSGLNQLQSLNLNFTEVTDAGLEYLSRLKQLQKLFLYTTKATVPGVETSGGIPACEIGSDAGQSPSIGGRAGKTTGMTGHPISSCAGRSSTIPTWMEHQTLRQHPGRGRGQLEGT